MIRPVTSSPTLNPNALTRLRPLETRPEVASLSFPSDPASSAKESSPQRTPEEISKKALIGPLEPTDCQTCRQRRYQDQSSDPGVSMKSPTALSPGNAESAVRAHEGEHVSRELSKAKQEGRSAMATVVLHTDVCPECGRVYMSGGTTRITSWGPSEKSAGKPEKAEKSALEKAS